MAVKRGGWHKDAKEGPSRVEKGPTGTQKEDRYIMMMMMMPGSNSPRRTCKAYCYYYGL